MYVGIAGASVGTAPEFPVGTNVGFSNSYGIYTNNGMLQWNYNISLRDATDGSSNTFIVAEQSGTVGTSDIRSGYYGGYLGANFAAPVTSTVQTSPSSSGSGSIAWSVGLSSFRYQPNLKSALTGTTNSYNPNTAWNSSHVGGIHTLLGDGSVRFVNENTDIDLLRRLSSRNDGQTVGDY